MARLSRHAVYGLIVESELRLASVAPACEPGAAALRIALGSPEYFLAKAAAVASDDEDWIRHGVLDDGSVYVKVHGVFETVVSADGRHAVCARLDDADERAFEANLLNFVISTALTLQGEEPLHATVLEFAGTAIGLLGASGAGKSTLAAALIAEGAGLVTDDMLRLTFAGGQALAHRGPHRLKLFDEPARRFLPEAMSRGAFDAMSGKMMIEPRQGAGALRAPLPVSALFWLGDPDATPPPRGVSARRLAGAELARSLVASAMEIRYHAPARLARQFRFAEQVARVLPVHALSYPRTFEVMDRVVELIRRTAPC